MEARTKGLCAAGVGRCLLVGTAFFAACGGQGPQGPAGPPGPSGSDIEVTPEPAGANCVAGGERVETGIMGDGGFQVEQTTFVCNGLEVAADGGADSGSSDGGDDTLCKSESRCGPGNTLQFCGDEGHWEKPVQCSMACISGMCVGALAVAAGPSTTCALLFDGVLRCWGANLLDVGDSTSPVPVPGLNVVRAISVGQSLACALFGNEVQCWGQSPYGVPSTSNAKMFGPAVIPGLTSPVMVSVGDESACVLQGDGTVHCWGFNFYGQLGDGTTTSTETPTTVSGLSGVTAISAGFDFACALLSNGTVECWGANDSGQLGNGTTSPDNAAGSTTPVVVSGLSGVTAISAGPEEACALMSGGTVKCWGGNRWGQLGSGASQVSSVPNAVAVPGLSGVASVIAGGSDTCAVLTDGTVKCWGMGEIATGTNAILAINPTPTTVPGLTGVQTVTLGGAACALRMDQSIVCWGDNSSGQLGNGFVGGIAPTPMPVDWKDAP